MLEINSPDSSLGSVQYLQKYLIASSSLVATNLLTKSDKQHESAKHINLKSHLRAHVNHLTPKTLWVVLILNKVYVV